MKSAIEVRNKLDRAIDDYLYSRLSSANKSHFKTDELKEIYQHYHNFINAVHEFIIKKETN